MVKVKGDKTRTITEQERNSAVKVERLICVDVNQNNNKAWMGYVLANGDAYCEYGRVNKALQHEYYSYGNVSDATTWLDNKSYEKQHKTGGKESYTLQKTIAASSGGVVRQSPSNAGTVTGSSLKALAAKQIKSDPETSKLVTWLADVNIHQITQTTQITYNVATGSFSTPLGLVTPDGISEARTILTDLDDYVDKHDWENPKYKKYLSQYLRIVPQDLGMTRGWHTTFLAGSNAIHKQSDILDALEAALQPVGTQQAAGSVPSEQVFNVTLNVISDKKKIAEIAAQYERMKGDHYDARHYKVCGAWEIHISTVRDAYAKDGAKLSNIWDLWHGTKASNLLSILKGGLIIPPYNAGKMAGRNYGNGVYFSDNSTKAIGYAFGRWGSYGNTPRTFMFISKVGMGKYYVPKSSVKDGDDIKLPSGYDSTFAKGGESGVENNEMVVYRVSQADLTYLVEFSQH